MFRDLASTTLVLMSATMLFISDFYHLTQRPHFPLTPMVISSMLCLFFGNLNIAFTGMASFPPGVYKLYQPFYGGVSFVATQSIAFLSIGVAMFGTTIYNYCFVRDILVGRNGVLFMMGVLVLIGSGMHRGSLILFKCEIDDDAGNEGDEDKSPTTATEDGGKLNKKKKKKTTSGGAAGVSSKGKGRTLKKNTSSKKALLKSMSIPPNPETILVIALLSGSCLLCGLADMVPSFAQPILYVCMGVHLFCGGVIHMYIGWKHTRGYRLFMPVTGGVKGTVAQCSAWLLFIATMYYGLYLASLPIRTATSSPATKTDMTYGILAVASAASCGSLLLFARTSKFDAKSPRSTSSLIHHGPFVLSALATVQAAFVLATTVFSQADNAWMQHISSSSDDGTPHHHLYGGKGGVIATQTVAILAMIMIPPLTHLLGTFSFAEVGYNVWMPFEGSSGFIAAQAIGWTFFGIGILTAVLQLSASGYYWLQVAAFAFSFAQFCIHGSLRVFRAEDVISKSGERMSKKPKSTNEKSAKKPSQLKLTSPTSGSEETTTTEESDAEQTKRGGSGSGGASFLNGELATAIILSITCLVLCSACDFYIDERNTFHQFVLVLALIAMTFATPLAHWSARQHDIKSFQPFQGGSEFAALQAAGWTLFSISVLTGIVTCVDNDFIAPRASARGYHMRWTVTGLLAQIPFLMITASIYVEWSKLHGIEKRTAAEDGEEKNGPKKQKANKKQHPPNEKEERLLTEIEVLVGNLDAESDARKKLQLALEELGRGTLIRTASVAEGTNQQLDSVAGVAPHKKKRTATVENAISAARVTIFVLSIASAVLFILAGLMSSSNDPSDCEIAVILCWAGIAATTSSIVGIHGFFGPFVHGEEAYKLFAPFSGGQQFMFISGIAWGTYGATLLLSIMFFTNLAPAFGTLLVASAFSIVSPATLFIAVLKHFEAHATPLFHDDIHAEGVLAGVLFLASISFTHIFATFAEDGTTSSVPVIISTMAMIIAVPMGLRALHKSHHQWHSTFSGPSSQLDENIFSPVTTPRHAKRHGGDKHQSAADRSAALLHLPTAAATTTKKTSPRTPFIVLEYTLLILTSLIPFMFLYGLHFAATQYEVGIAVTIQYGQMIWGVVQGGVIIVLLSRTVDQKLPQPLKNFRYGIMTCCLYMIPTFIALFSYLLPIVHPERVSFMFAISITLFTLAANDMLKRILQAGLWLTLGVSVYERGGVILHYFFFDLANVDDGVEEDGVLWTTFLLLEEIACVLGWMYYSRSYFRRPEVTGSQYHPGFSDWMRKWMIDDVAKYFSFSMIVEPKAKNLFARAKQKHIMLFHPHGIFPGTAMWAPHTTEWAKVMGTETTTTTHAATILFNGPFQRDVILGLGGRVVTKQSICKSLHEGNCTVIVPGGQAEMILSLRSNTEMHLVTHHVGFLRLAITENAPLLPTLCFNEANKLDNIHCHKIQKAFLKRVGFGFPVLPHGKWYLPIPITQPLTLVVGEPIQPPSYSGSGERGDPELEALVQELKVVYFERVKALFEKHKAACGYPNMKLILHDK